MIYPAEERRAQHNVNKTAEGKLLWKKDKEGDPRLMGARQGKKCKEDFQDFARQHGQVCVRPVKGGHWTIQPDSLEERSSISRPEQSIRAAKKESCKGLSGKA